MSDQKESQKRYREANKEKIKEQKKRHYEAHKEEIAEYHKKYREEHKEEKREYNKRYNQEHRQEISKREKVYRQENKEQISQYMKSYKKQYMENDANKARQKELSRIHHEENKEARNQRNKERYIKNKEQIREKGKSNDFKNHRNKIARERRKIDKTYQIKQYGLTNKDLLTMIGIQNNCCKICGNAFKSDNHEPCVDHDHNTGYVRGLLCRCCNWLLGCSLDSPSILLKGVWWILKDATDIKYSKHIKKQKPAFYSGLKQRQKNGCGICEISFDGITERHTHLDHDHSTGLIRGILCSKCNRLVGYSRDSSKIMLGAISYLLDHSERKEA